MFASGCNSLELEAVRREIHEQGYSDDERYILELESVIEWVTEERNVLAELLEQETFEHGYIENTSEFWITRARDIISERRNRNDT